MGDELLARNLAQHGIRDERVLRAIASLERARFVPEEAAAGAARDQPLAIGFGQTISQPFIVAYMTEVLAPAPGERILEIGTGSGYQAAVLARLGAEVFSIEIIPQLARAARERLSALGLGSIHLRQGDGRGGWPEEAPFDGIILTAAAERMPETLLWQLRPGGRLVAPIGAPRDPQSLVVVRKGEEGSGEVRQLLPVRFVPLTSSSVLPS